MPKPHTSNNRVRGLYDKSDFRYISDEDAYQCPTGEKLKWRMKTIEKGQTLYRYWSSDCQSCKFKSKCTSGKERRVTRWEHEAILDKAERRLAQKPEMMRVRSQTAEHPFGTLKHWMGATHFQMKTLEHVSTEMSLHVLAYNMKRVINILGVKALLEAMMALTLLFIAWLIRQNPNCDATKSHQPIIA